MAVLTQRHFRLHVAAQYIVCAAKIVIDHLRGVDSSAIPLHFCNFKITNAIARNAGPWEPS